MRCSYRTSFLLPLALCASLVHGATFTITTVGTPPDAQADAAVQMAADIWGGILESTVPIKVQVTWVPLGGSSLGLTLPNGRKDLAGLPMPSTWYVTALANSITGVEENPGEKDFDVFLNSGVSWYTGLDGNPGAGQYDLVSIALHEFGHGLGFVGLSKKDGTVGSFGMVEAADFFPAVTSFPWPQLDTLPSVFDIYLEHSLDGPLTAMTNPGTQLGTAFTSDQVYFHGPLTMATNGANAVRIYAPGLFALGSSCVHFNENTFPPGDPNALMTPFSGAGEVEHWPGQLCLALMQDIGWNLAPDVGIAERPRAELMLLWPNPANDLLHVPTNDPSARISVCNSQGKELLTSTGNAPVDVSTLAAGHYVVILRSENGVERGRFIKQ